MGSHGIKDQVAIAERGAPHPDDRDLVLDPVRGHCSFSLTQLRTGRAFQK